MGASASAASSPGPRRGSSGRGTVAAGEPPPALLWSLERDNEKIRRAYLLEVLCKLVRSVKLFLTLRRLASTYGGGKTGAVISLGGGFRVVLFFIGEANGLPTHLGERRDYQVVPMPKGKWEKKLSLPQTIHPPPKRNSVPPPHK